jgi:hypothetical protein
VAQGRPWAAPLAPARRAAQAAARGLPWAALRALPAPAVVAVGWALLPPGQPLLGEATFGLWSPLLAWVGLAAPALSGGRRGWGAGQGRAGVAAFHAAWALALAAWAAAGAPAPLLGLYLVNRLLWQPYRRFAARQGRPLGLLGGPCRAPRGRWTPMIFSAA